MLKGIGAGMEDKGNRINRSGHVRTDISPCDAFYGKSSLTPELLDSSSPNVFAQLFDGRGKPQQLLKASSQASVR